MLIKSDLSLLRDTQNYVSLPKTTIKKIVTSNFEEMVSIINLYLRRVNHFSTITVNKHLKDKDIVLVNMEKYLLPVTYDLSNKLLLLNLSFFGTTDVTKLDTRDVYSLLVYGLMFKGAVTKKVSVSSDYIPIIADFFSTIFIKLFGKDYGLLGSFSSEINKLRFLLFLYIGKAFFNIDSPKLYSKAAALAGFDYTVLVEELPRYDFSKPSDFIKSLSNLEIMPGLTVYRFSSKWLTQFRGVPFLAGFEDFSRFLSVMSCSNLVGTTIAPTFLDKYNRSVYKKVLSMVEISFRKV